MSSDGVECECVGWVGEVVVSILFSLSIHDEEFCWFHDLCLDVYLSIVCIYFFIFTNQSEKYTSLFWPYWWNHQAGDWQHCLLLKYSNKLLNQTVFFGILGWSLIRNYLMIIIIDPLLRSDLFWITMKYLWIYFFKAMSAINQSWSCQCSTLESK